MAEANDTIGILYQNLEDAGCNPQTIKTCMSIMENGNKKDLLPLLFNQREKRLKHVHMVQKQIDCLDYLIYQTQKEND